MADEAYDSVDNSAILLMTLDEDTAAEVFKHMSIRESQELGQRMASLQNVTSEQFTSVLQQFNEELEQYSGFNAQSSDHVRSILVKALGEERASGLLQEMMESGNDSGIETLNTMEPNVVAEMIRDEHPQIIATIIVHLNRRQAADILLNFDDTLRDDVVLRVATFSGVQPAALQELTEVLDSMLDGQNLKRSKMGGASTAAEILNLLNSAQEERVLNAVRQHDNDLADRIIDEMFVFEDLANVENTVIQRILRELDTDSLTIALKGAPEEILQRFTDNMARRAADLLIEDMEMRGPIRLSLVETERKKILEIVRRLADTGEISLSRDDTEYV